jgi:uncharacterized protein (TIGR02246 family)
MKMKITFATLTMLLAVSVSSIFAQTAVSGSQTGVDEQVAQFTQTWQDAFNRADAKAIAALFTANAERTDTEGATATGTDQIAAHYTSLFKSGYWKVKIRTESTAQLADGTIVSTGSFRSTGTDASGAEVVRSGTFRNELIRQNKQFFIRRMKLHDSL